MQQQIRLIVNVLTPDNLEKKFQELREMIFGDMKVSGELGFNELENKLLTEQLNEDNMNLTVETIFRKAQNEKQYCNFYGDICERMIRLELMMRGFKTTQKNIKESNFRKVLLDHCKLSFNQFFDKEIQEKRLTMDNESLSKLRQKLFGSTTLF